MATKTQNSTIALLGFGNQKERAATAVISPGHLVEIDGAGIKPQATAGAVCANAYALENEVFGKDIDVDYKVKDNVIYSVFSSGQEVQAKVAANAAAIAVGDAVQAGGAGTVGKQAGDGAVIGYALTAVDNSGSAKQAFIKIEVK